MKFIYPAIIRKETDGHYKAVLPDLEGCVAEGDSIDEVLDNANAAAAEWITVELETEIYLPPVSDMEDLCLNEGEFVRNICVTMRMSDGYDE